MPTKKKPTLTYSEIMLVKELAKGKSQGEAGMIATGSTSLASGAVQANRMLKNVNVREAVDKALENKGITIDNAVQPIADGLIAEKVHIVGNGDQAMAEVVPDHSIRLKASGMALKLLGAEQNEGGNTLTINIGDRTNSKKYIENES